MRKLAMGMIALLAAAGLNATSAYAQGTGPAVDFAVGGGISVPTGDFDDGAKLGWQGTAAVRVLPQSLPVGFQLDGTFGRFSDESALDIQSQVVYGTANVVYRFQTAEATRFQPYLIGGIGVYNLDAKGDDVSLIGNPDSQTKFGINAGAGFDFKAGSAGLFIEGRFHNAFFEGSDLQFIPVTVGVRFGGR